MNSTRVGRQTQAQTGSVGHEAAPQQADFGVQAGAGNVGQVGVGQPGVSHVDPQAEYGAPGSQQPHLGHMAGLEHSGNAAQGGISRVDPQAEYAAPGSQYNQAGNQTRQGQTGKGFAHAMNGSSGVNKDAAQGGVYEGGRPL